MPEVHGHMGSQMPRKHGRLDQPSGQVDAEIAKGSCRRQRLAADMVVDQFTDSSGERDHWRYIILQRDKRHLLVITKWILIQARSIPANGGLDERCVEIHDVSKLILRKSVSDRARLNQDPFRYHEQ